MARHLNNSQIYITLTIFTDAIIDLYIIKGPHERDKYSAAYYKMTDFRIYMQQLRVLLCRF
jgi:hypothetical protein